MDVLRLAFAPKSVTTEGGPLHRRRDLQANGYTVEPLANGDAILTVRHDACREIEVTGRDPQQSLDTRAFALQGPWTTGAADTQPGITMRTAEAAGAAATTRFAGNQARLIGRLDALGGRAEVYLDGVRQWAPIDCWNPQPRDSQVLWYRNGLAPGEHTLRIVALGAANPYSAGSRVSLECLDFSAAGQPCNFPSGTGPRGYQRLTFGHTGRQDYRDSQGNLWRPGTEFVVRLGSGKDSVAESWWTAPATNAVNGTTDPELYRYGVHGAEFWANLTVGPGRYHARLKFLARPGLDDPAHRFNILINGRKVVDALDVAATAGGVDRAVDLVFNDLAPSHGAFEIRFQAAHRAGPKGSPPAEAFIQAIELGPGRAVGGARPVSRP